MVTPRNTIVHQQRQKEGKEHAGHKGYAPKTRYGKSMHLACIWHIVQFALHTELKDARYDNTPTCHTNNKR